MKKENKKSTFQSKLEKIKKIISSKEFKHAAKELGASVKDLGNSMDVFK